jgi:hypothetical protein
MLLIEVPVILRYAPQNNCYLDVLRTFERKRPPNSHDPKARFTYLGILRPKQQ